MTTILRRALLCAALIAGPTLADAQLANIPGVYLSGSAPTGFSSQAFKMNCNNATPTAGQCWPLLQIYDGATPATVNAGDNGLTVHVANTNTNGAAAPGASSPVVSATMLHASTSALGTSLVAKASAGNLGAYNCTGIAGAAAGYCIVYNGASAPSTGALTGASVLDFCYFDTTAKGCSLTRLPNSIAFSTGIVVLITSAASPYTYTTGTDTGAIEADYF